MSRIFIAEDDPDVRQVITHLMKSEGHAVSALRDGQQVVESLRWDAPDLLILDIMMPAMDGYDVLEEMARSGSGRHTRVLVLTAKAGEKDFEQSLSLGAARHMTKPFDPDELIDAVNDLLSLSADEVRRLREDEHHRASLLSQLESLLGD
ncbi:MAG TPA: response regulator [Actinomycetota bacterium]|nr:response regulator [Actinomycetota bacterium]